jgi:hypothetical protein
MREKIRLFQKATSQTKIKSDALEVLNCGSTRHGRDHGPYKLDFSVELYLDADFRKTQSSGR